LRDLGVLEGELTEVGHEDCGAVIFEEWRLPSALIACARYHHSPLRAPKSERRLAALINVGSTLALMSGSGMALEPAGAPADPEALQCLEIDAGQLAEAAKSIAGRLADMKQALQGP
jgi:HD-like signal output (HDOD) protein